MTSRSPAARHIQEAHLFISIVTETYPPEVNGVAMTSAKLVDGLMRRGHRICLVRPLQYRGEVAKATPLLSEMLVAGMRLPLYAGLRIGLPAARLLERAWTEPRPQVVHVVTEGPLGRSAVIAARRLGIPVSSGYHTNFDAYSKHYGFGLLRPLVAAYLKRFHNRAARTLVPTRQLKFDLARQGYQGLRVVARGVDTTLYSPERRSDGLRRAWGLQDRDLAVLYVGRLAREKNMSLVLSAFEQVRRVVPSARLVLVGDGPQRTELERRHPDHIFTGMRLKEDLAVHYASGDLFLFPSVTETFGNVTLEAMASGLAVIAFDYAAAREHIQHGRSGMLAPYAEAKRFTELAVQVASDPESRVRLGSAARAAALEVSWHHVVEVFAGALSEIALRTAYPHA
jgi:glycosyltransferase involved in cell wall biosynthesis